MFTTQVKLLVGICLGIIVSGVVYNQFALSHELNALSTDVAGIHATLSVVPSETPVPTASPTATITPRSRVFVPSKAPSAVTPKP